MQNLLKQTNVREESGLKASNQCFVCDEERLKRYSRVNFSLCRLLMYVAEKSD